MAQLTMYPGKINSPATTLSDAILDDTTTIPVTELSVFPAGPNLAVIGTGETAETILYADKSAASGAGNLTTCTRGFQGTAIGWGSGTIISRLFTAYDYDTLRANIADMYTVTKSIFLSAQGGVPRYTNGCAPPARTEAATNYQNYYTLDFDTAADEFANWIFVMPDSYGGGTLTAIFYWTAASGSGTVKWYGQGRAYANDDAISQAWGTAVGVEDTLITALDVHVTAATGAITLAGSPAGGQLVIFQVYRDASEDTLDVDAKLIGVKLEYAVNSVTD